MSQRYFCEFCGRRFNNPMAAISCMQSAACRAFGTPPKDVELEHKTRGCALTLAKTAAELMAKSPAGKQLQVVRDMADKIIFWAHRVENSLVANTPISLGKRTRIHNGLVDFVWANIWKKKEPLPNLHALELAIRCAGDAREVVREKIEKGEHGRFWFIDEHPEWLLYEAINMPLAVCVTKLKKRGAIPAQLDRSILAWTHRKPGEKPTEELVADMLRASWADELRSWNYLILAMEKATKWITANGSQSSLDLSRHNVDEKYGDLLAYTWDDAPREEPKRPKLKMWLVNDRFWVAAESRGQAKDVLTRDSGHIPKSVRGVPAEKKLYDETGLLTETVQEILGRVTKAQLVGVEK